MVAPVPCNDPLALASRAAADDCTAAPDTGALAMAERICAGHVGPAELRFLRHGFSTWLRAAGSLNLETCLRLPATPAQVRIARRDAALVSAAQEISASGPWALSVRLADEMGTYATRGGWSTWGGLETPPPGCSALRIALHRALRHNDGECLSASQIYRIVRHISVRKCRAETATLNAPQHESEP